MSILYLSFHWRFYSLAFGDYHLILHSSLSRLHQTQLRKLLLSLWHNLVVTHAVVADCPGSAGRTKNLWLMDKSTLHLTDWIHNFSWFTTHINEYTDILKISSIFPINFPIFFILLPNEFRCCRPMINSVSWWIAC